MSTALLRPTLTLLLLFLVFIVCSSSKAKENSDASAEEPKPAEQKNMATVTRDTISENPRPRLKAILDETIPGYEAVDSRDGHYDVVRVNQDGEIHTVVYYAVKNELVDQLEKIANSLR